MPNLGIDHFELRRTRHHNRLDFSVCGRALHGPQVFEFHHSVLTGGNLVFIGDLGRRTTYVERTQRQLRSRLTNGLGCNDADSLTLLDETVGAQGAAVALGTDAPAALARQYRAHLHFVNARLFDAPLPPLR